MHTLRKIGRQAVPLGAVLATTAAAVISTATPAAAFAPVAGSTTLSTTRGPSGGGNDITVTTTGLTVASPATDKVQFQFKATATSECSEHWSAPAAIAVTGATQTAGVIEVPQGDVDNVTAATTLNFTVPTDLALAGSQTAAAYNVCIYDTNNMATSVLLAATAYTAAGAYVIVPKTTLSAPRGPSGGGNTLTLTSTTPNTFTSSTVSAQFHFKAAANTNYCTAALGTPTAVTTSAGIVTATNVGVITPTKVVVTVPAGVVLPAGPTTLSFHVCVYDSTSLIAGTGFAAAGNVAGPYSIAATASIDTVTPSAGPAQGGTVITVVGTNFPTDGSLTASLGGQNLTPTVNSTGTSFTATLPAHSAGGPYNLTVGTLGGSTTKTAAFTYTNGIAITPNTAPNTKLTRTWLDVRGVGFSELAPTNTSGSNANGAGAHVYLVRGSYDPKPVSSTVNNKINGQVLECVDVLVIDDTELVCALFLGGNLASTGVNRAVTGCTATSGTPTLTNSASSTSTCVFTTADIGMVVTGTGIAAATIITAVSSTGATLSTNVTAAISATAVLTLTPTRTVTDATIASGANTMTSASFPFRAADVGKAVKGTGIPAGTYIVSVAGGTATLSSNATAANPASTEIFVPTGIPIGTYSITVVNNGAVNAQATAGYVQSIISSGSTFTVADY